VRVLYDGSFEGFLTLVYDVYYEKISVESILKKMPSELMFDSLHEVIVDDTKSQTVLKALQVKFSKDNFELILHIFMCDTKDFELDLLCFIVKGFRSQRELQNINIPCIFNLKSLQKEFFHVYHKMSGFLRFEELEDATLYAKVDAKYNVLYLLGKHFSKRLNNQKYIIHDIKRELAFLHTKEFVGVQKVADYEIPLRSESEEKFQNLWKTFFDSVAIKSRKNKKLQQQTVPLIYRTYMTEFNV
jgi:probable DNA metabolism protein